MTKDQIESSALHAETDDVKSNPTDQSQVNSSGSKTENGDDSKLPKSEGHFVSNKANPSRLKNLDPNQQRKNNITNDLEKAQCNLKNAENDLEKAEHNLEETKDALKNTEKSLEEMKRDEKGESSSNQVTESHDEKDSKTQEVEIKDLEPGENLEKCKGELEIEEVEPKIIEEKLDAEEENSDIIQEDLIKEKSSMESSEIEIIDQESLVETKDEVTKDAEDAIQESLISQETEKLINIPDQLEENSEGHKVESESSKVTVKRKEESEECKVEGSNLEVGIVGEPTAVTELISDDELRVESTLSIDEKLQDHVAQWVENTVKVDGPISGEQLENDEDHLEKKAIIKKRKEILKTTFRKRRQIVNHIIKRSIKCLNKMHAMDGSGANGKKLEAAEKKGEEDPSRQSPQVPQSQQNGAALPEETAAAAVDRLHSSVVKEEPYSETNTDSTKNSTTDATLSKQQEGSRTFRSDDRESRKRRSSEEVLSINGNSTSKRICIEQRDQLVSSLITGYENATAEELASRADVLRVELRALDELARAAEVEWNRVLTMRKLKEEAFLRIERRRQVVNFMEGNENLSDMRTASNATTKEKSGFLSRDDQGESFPQDNSGPYKNDKSSKSHSQQQSGQNASNKQTADARKQADALNENRQIGEGRQGPIVDVRSIIADYRLRHPETVPRRGRRMRNNVNVGLGAGGAMVEAGQNADSRPSSTDSCKSNSNVDASNSMSFKDVLVQFAKLSQQQGEPVKTPQNYPDVTLHPVAPSPTTQNSAPPQTGSLLHGILTKAQSPRPTTFSPTLARLLTAPERERSVPATTVTSHPSSATQRILQGYQEPNPVSISDLLSSSKSRTEITITPVVNTPVQSHINNIMHVDDLEEESVIIDERESRISGGNREDRDISPRCQGCHERAAQYVCAGCGNQWYCSPECQAAAWDEHSEVCSG